MVNIKKESALVIFTEEFPKKKQGWWKQFDTVIAPKQFKSIARHHELAFVDIESLIDPGSVQEASELARELSLLKVSDGRRLSKIVNYKGFELWWIHYDDLTYKFCLPYTEYCKLLQRIKDYSYLCLYNPPSPSLFCHYLNAHSCNYQILNTHSKKLPPLGIIIQIILSVPFLLWLGICRTRLMVWTSDLFDPPRDHDFRMRYIYEELKNKKIKFVEFIRSMESYLTVMQHALRRKRPVIYSFAISNLTYYLANLFDQSYERELHNLYPSSNADPMSRFWFGIATSYIKGTAGDIWSIKIMKLILRLIGIKVSIVPAANSRNFHEVLACKLSGIPIVGILHGLSSKDYIVYDFMPEFDGERTLSVDKYGLWSEWWKEYYLNNSKAYRPEQLYLSGLMRPIEKSNGNFTSNPVRKGGLIKVLFVSEHLAAPNEIMPYLNELLKERTLDFTIKFRPNKDRFEEWLLKNQPNLLKAKNIKILRGRINDAIAECDVIIGSHSTAVFEALLQSKMPVLFDTHKWGDCFSLKEYGNNHPFFAKTPQELVERIKKARTVSRESLVELRKRFLGDPYMNGSKWVVGEVEKFL